MANTNLTTSIIAKEALARLTNELGFMDTFYRGYDNEFDKSVNGYMIGDTLSIRRPADFTVRSGATMSVQDVIEGKTTLVVDKQVGVDFQFTTTELTLNIDELGERVIQPAIDNIVNEIARDCLATFYPQVYNWVGTPGETINSFTDFVKGPERLDEMAVPSSMRSALLSPPDFYGLLGTQSALYIQDAAKAAYRSGDLGKLSGVETFMSQVVPTHTTGARGGTPLVNGGSQAVSYDTAKDSWSQSLITDGWTASAAPRVKAGDVFTIANVFMVNPKTKASTGILQQFTVLADGSSDGSGNLTMTIAPAIIASGPHQTVNAGPADNAALTFLGSASTGYKQNLVYHKNAFAMVVVPRAKPAGVVDWSRATRNGISLTIEPVRDGANDVSKYRLDVLYGRKCIEPRLATRVSGTA